MTLVKLRTVFDERHNRLDKNGPLMFDHTKINTIDLIPYLTRAPEPNEHSTFDASIDKKIVDWLYANIDIDGWWFDLCGMEIAFLNAEDSWKTLEFLEEFSKE